MEAFAEYMQKWGWAFTFVGALAAFIYFVVNIKRSTKQFSYQVILDLLLFTRGEQPTTEKIEVHYAGKKVDCLRLVLVELGNSGGKEIEAKDFVEPVRIRFREAPELLDTILEGASPDGFAPKIRLDGTDVVLEPCLMNPGDRLRVMVYVPSEQNTKLTVMGRISGVSRILPYGPVGRAGAAEFRRALLMGGIGGGFLLSIAIRENGFGPAALLWAVLMWAITTSLLILARHSSPIR